MPLGIFAEKHVLKPIDPFSCHCLAIKAKLTKDPFTGCACCHLLFQMQFNVSFCRLGMCRNQNFEIDFSFESDTAVLTSSFCFSVLIFFFCWELLGFWKCRI